MSRNVRRGDAPVHTLRIGQEIDVRVEKGVYRGLGLARHEGQVVFVPRGLPGDHVRVRVKSLHRGYVVATAISRTEDARERRRSPCLYFPRCGGCSYQDLDYAAQLRLKTEVLSETLARAGVVAPAEIPNRASPEDAWRTRASFHVSVGSSGIRLGFYEEGTRQVVDLERCLHLSSSMNHSARSLLAGLKRWPGPVARLRELDVMESFEGDALVACLVGDLSAREASTLGTVVDGAPAISGFGCVGREGRFVSLKGEPYVFNRVGTMRLRAHVLSFFQANRYLTEPLLRTVVDAIGPGGCVLDLYAGVGLFTLPLAAQSDSVFAAEGNTYAVQDLEFNLESPGFGNVRIHGGDVAAALDAWPRTAGERVVLDPPRAGAGVVVVRAIASRRPEGVVYVSCDPATLGRDLAVFVEEGYALESLQAFDLFPDTFHVETVARLRLR